MVVAVGWPSTTIRLHPFVTVRSFHPRSAYLLHHHWTAEPIPMPSFSQRIRRVWPRLIRFWSASGLRTGPLPDGRYRIRNKRSGAFAGLQDANRYSDMISLLPGMGSPGGDVVGT